MDEIHKTQNNEFTYNLRKLQTTDKAHADIFNELFDALLQNDIFLNTLADTMIKKTSIIHETDNSDPNNIPGADVTANLQKQITEQNNYLTGKRVYEVDLLEWAMEQNKSQNFLVLPTCTSLPIESKFFNGELKILGGGARQLTLEQKSVGRFSIFHDGAVWSKWNTPAETTLERTQLGTVEEINNYYDNIHNAVNDFTYYQRVSYHDVAHPVLGGGNYYIEGFRTASPYGWQRAVCYDTTGARIFYRSINNNVWNAWVKK